MVSKAEIKRVQKMINSGICWRLESSVGRYCMDMIRGGYCYLGLKGHRDYYGNYVPSRFEVQKGTKGSIEFVKKMAETREIDF
jgi:hypothetical protein